MLYSNICTIMVLLFWFFNNHVNSFNNFRGKEMITIPIFVNGEVSTEFAISLMIIGIITFYICIKSLYKGHNLIGWSVQK